jgi:hypothetical protein
MPAVVAAGRSHDLAAGEGSATVVIEEDTAARPDAVVVLGARRAEILRTSSGAVGRA